MVAGHAPVALRMTGLLSGGPRRGFLRIERSRGSLRQENPPGYAQGWWPVSSSGRRDPLAALELRMKAGSHARGLPDPEFLLCSPPPPKNLARSNEIISCCSFAGCPRCRAANCPFSFTNLPGHRRALPCHHKALNSISATQAASRSGGTSGEEREDQSRRANFSPCGHPVAGLARIEVVAA